MRPREPAQFVLPVGLPGAPSMDNFWPGPNREARDHLGRLLAGDGERFLYLRGPPGCGKTHLLLAACHRVSGAGASPVYVPLSDPSRFAPPMLRGLEGLDLICVDGPEGVAGRDDWERALFHLFNRAADAGTRLLVASRAAPASLGVALGDLRSRLASGLVLRLEVLDDAGRRRALQQRATERGFSIPDDAMEYLLRREARDMHSLFALLDRLDRATLRSQRRVTVPFVRGLLAGSRGDPQTGS